MTTEATMSEQATVELVNGLREHARRMVDVAARTLTEAEAVLTLADTIEQREETR